MKKSVFCGFAAAITVIMVVALIAMKAITFEGGRSVILVVSLLSVFSAWSNVEEQERKNMLLWSFSMYIFEPFCKLFFEETYFNYVSPRFPMILNSVVWCFFCMIAGGTVGALLKKVPVVRSLL